MKLSPATRAVLKRLRKAVPTPHQPKAQPARRRITHSQVTAYMTWYMDNPGGTL